MLRSQYASDFHEIAEALKEILRKRSRKTVQKSESLIFGNITTMNRSHLDDRIKKIALLVLRQFVLLRLRADRGDFRFSNDCFSMELPETGEKRKFGVASRVLDARRSVKRCSMKRAQ